MSEINDARAALEAASADEETFREVYFPKTGRTFLAKRLLWSEADAALQAGTEGKRKADAADDEVTVDIVRYNRSLFAYGIYFKGAADAEPVRVYNPRSEADLRKIERLPKADVKAGLDAIREISEVEEGADEAAKNDSSGTGDTNSPSLSLSASDGPTLTVSSAA